MGQSLHVPLLDSKTYCVGTIGYWWNRKKVFMVQNNDCVTFHTEGYPSIDLKQVDCPFGTIHAVQLSPLSIMITTDVGSRMVIARHRDKKTQRFCLEARTHSSN